LHSADGTLADVPRKVNIRGPVLVLPVSTSCAASAISGRGLKHSEITQLPPPLTDFLVDEANSAKWNSAAQPSV